MNYRMNRSVGKSPRSFKNTDSLSIPYSQPLTRFKELKFKVEDIMRTSKNDNLFRKRYKPQFTDEILEILAVSTKNLQHTSSKISTRQNFGIIL